MVKILIVDDFLADRRSIRLLLSSFTHLDIEITGEAENGLQALELIEINRPDVVISDIEMPISDGFDLAKNIRQQYPEIKIIFCSLYDEFEYARNAMYFGGYGYILKPVDAQDLILCIQRVTGQLSTEAQYLKNRQEYEDIRLMLQEYKPVLAEDYIKELIYGENQRSAAEVWERIQYLDIPLQKGGFVLGYIEIDDFDKITSEVAFEQKQIFFIKIITRIKDVFNKQGPAAIVRLGDAHVAVVFSFDEPLLKDGMKSVIASCERVLMEFIRSDVSLTIAVSEMRPTIHELKNLYEQCLYQMKHKFLLGKGKIILPEDVPSSNRSIDIDFSSIQKEIMFLLNSGTEKDIKRYTHQLFYAASPSSDIKYLKNLCFCIVISIQIHLNECNETFADVYKSECLIWEELLRFETITDAAVWIENTLLVSHDYLAAKSKSRNMQIVEKVKKYLEVNFSKNFNLDVMAADLFYSPNYLNRIFKQEMGETIFDYATIFRIEKAKELLHDPNIKLASVSETLGYSNSAYFSFVFKKATGLSPREYRERFNDEQ